MRCFHPTSPHGSFLALFTLLYKRKLFTQLSWDACWPFGQCSPYCNSPSPHLAVTPSYKMLPLLFDRILWKTSFHDGPYDLHSWDSIPCLILSLCLWTGPNQSFSSVPQLCQPLCNSMDCRHQASLSIINSQSLLKLISIESVMPSSFIFFSSCLQSFPGSGSFPKG